MSRLARPACALLLASAAACKLFDDGDDDPGSLALSGTVRSARTATAPSRPIAGARVRVYWEGGLAVPGDGRLLGEATTDTAGRFETRVATPPGYAGPNCAVMRPEVSAPGFGTVAYVDIVGTGGPNDTTCESGRGTLDVELPPL